MARKEDAEKTLFLAQKAVDIINRFRRENIDDPRVNDMIYFATRSALQRTLFLSSIVYDDLPEAKEESYIEFFERNCRKSLAFNRNLS
jgi:hypothetical protein